MTTINPDSFTVTGEKDSEYFEDGTVELNMRDGTVLADAFRSKSDGEICVRGFVGRYRTSPRAWRATVCFKQDGTIRYVDFGRDDRSGRFNKRNAISYEPEAYKTAAR